MKTLRALFVKETELAYEPGRDAIASVTNRVGFNHDQLLSQYGYAIDADGQRISRTTTHGGETFTDVFGFDPDTGGLTTSKRAGSVDANHTYAVDKIGNREVATSGQKTPITYQPNALNQYVGIEGDTSIALAHDADGNLTRRGDRTFTWDANNRSDWRERRWTAGGCPKGETSVGRERVNRLIATHDRGIFIARYTYDHQSRRIARWTRDGVDERYLYQGWNLIAVYHPGEPAPVETYTWGKDLSGSLQGAGGVGGPLFAKKRGHGQDAWIYHYDASGNVTEVTDSKGNLLDHYEYHPFGNLASAPQLPGNRFRFSTKLQDAETAFYYYGYRYYDPVDGRWLSRDPIGEHGGLSLYGFAGNDTSNRLDYLGLCAWIGETPSGNPLIEVTEECAALRGVEPGTIMEYDNATNTWSVYEGGQPSDLSVSKGQKWHLIAEVGVACGTSQQVTVKSTKATKLGLSAGITGTFGAEGNWLAAKISAEISVAVEFQGSTEWAEETSTTSTIAGPDQSAKKKRWCLYQSYRIVTISLGNTSAEITYEKLEGMDMRFNLNAGDDGLIDESEACPACPD